MIAIWSSVQCVSPFSYLHFLPPQNNLHWPSPEVAFRRNSETREYLADGREVRKENSVAFGEDALPEAMGKEGKDEDKINTDG